MRLKLAIFALLMGSASASSAALLSYDFTNLPGSQVSVDLNVTDLGGEIVSAFDLDFLYNDSVLAVNSLTQHEVLGDSSWFEAIYDPDPLGLFCQAPTTGGCLSIYGVSFLDDATLDALQGDVVTLATVVFDILDSGFTGWEFFTDLALGKDVKGRMGPDGTANVIVPAAAVPEPGTLSLLGFGLLALLLGRRTAVA